MSREFLSSLIPIDGPFISQWARVSSDGRYLATYHPQEFHWTILDISPLYPNTPQPNSLRRPNFKHIDFESKSPQEVLLGSLGQIVVKLANRAMPVGNDLRRYIDASPSEILRLFDQHTAAVKRAPERASSNLDAFDTALEILGEMRRIIASAAELEGSVPEQLLVENAISAIGGIRDLTFTLLRRRGIDAPGILPQLIAVAHTLSEDFAKRVGDPAFRVQ